MKISASLVCGMGKKIFLVEGTVYKPFMLDFEKWLNMHAKVMHERQRYYFDVVNHYLNVKQYLCLIMMSFVGKHLAYQKSGYEPNEMDQKECS